MHGNGSCRDQHVTRYSRQDVLRILHLRARQLTAWEQAGLIPANEQYSFEDLAQLRTLRALRATRISAKSIRESVEAMRRAAGMGNPFTEASAVSHGAHLSFRHNGALVDPVTRQLAFDRLADALGGDARGAQRAQGAQLGQVFKGVLFVGWNQPRLLPRGQLARSQVQDSQDVSDGCIGSRVGLDRNRSHASDASMQAARATRKGVHRHFIKYSWITCTKRGSPWNDLWISMAGE